MGVNLFNLSPSKYVVAAFKGDDKRCSSCSVNSVFCKKICKHRNSTVDEVLLERRVKNGNK